MANAARRCDRPISPYAQDCGIVGAGMDMEPHEQGDEQPLYRYAFGTVEFDEARGELRVGGRVVELAPRPLQALACLLHLSGAVVPLQEVFATVWCRERRREVKGG